MEVRPPGPPRTLACPVCGAAMEVVVKAKIPVDRCPLHGVWLDRGELEGLIQGLGSRRGRAVRLAAQSARNQGRVQGAVFGFWSLLFD